MKIKIILLPLLFAFCLASLQAQVTIGSNIPAREGSYLDLKENANTGHDPNSEKGMGLPRVALFSLTELTIDEESKKNEYVGTAVYNTTNDSNIKEGIYCWLGGKWMQTIVVDSKGSSGTLLKSNGDGTFGWSSVTIPTYMFHKPTQVMSFDPSKASPKSYRYRDIVWRETGSYIYEPSPGLFDNDFVYQTKIQVKTDIAVPKYLLLGTTILIRKETVGDKTPPVSTWEYTQVEIILNDGTTDRVVKTYLRTFSMPAGGNTTTYIDMFSLVSLNGFLKGGYTLKIRVSNIDNSFNYNETSNYTSAANAGKYYSGNVNFYNVSMEDLGLVLYEYE